MSKNNHRIIENCDNFLDNSCHKTTAVSISDYISKMFFGLDLHIQHYV